MPFLAYVQECIWDFRHVFFSLLVLMIIKAKNLMLHLRLPKHQLYTQHEHFIGKHKQLFSSSWLMVFHWSQSALSSAFWNHLETSVLVCLAITTNPPLRRASNYLLFSLVIADLIVTLMCEPLILEFISKLTFFHGCITSLKQLAYNTLVSLSCQTSIIHLASISLDRFVAVGFPLRHKIFIEKVDLRWCS